MPSKSLPPKDQNLNKAFILPLSEIDAGMVSLVGGKAANLGELIGTGFSVPDGFCITTSAYELMSQNAGLNSIISELNSVNPADIARIEKYADNARASLLSVSIPDMITDAIGDAYHRLVDGDSLPVAVRSSATAEDLPFASFAGQQDTYLNIIGINAVLDAVQHCWASLWTERAVSYRTNLGIDHSSVRLAVIVQCLVNAKVAGVLFSANPLTWKRRQAVINANPGLGEAVVSGAVIPDYFVVNSVTGEIVERRLGDKKLIIQPLSGGGTERLELTAPENKPCLTDDQIKGLIDLGVKVESHYGTPQDIEWAIDDSGQVWLTQTRPITTLYPLPYDAPISDDNLRIYYSLNVSQGMEQPFTPMGKAIFRLLLSSITTYIGFPPRDPLAGPSFLTEGGERLFFDITKALRSSLGQKILIQIIGTAEVRAGAAIQKVAEDPRIAPIYTSKLPFIRRGLFILLRLRIPVYVMQSFVSPKATHSRINNIQNRFSALTQIPKDASPNTCLTMVEQLFFNNMAPLLLSIMPAVLLPGMGSMSFAKKLLGDLATEDEREKVLRALPYNPTTEMNMALWDLTQQVREDSVTMQLALDTPPDQLTRKYFEGTLPPVLQQGMAGFLQSYGHRCVAELDGGLPRWSEDPSPVFGMMINYLRLDKPSLAPDMIFRRSVEEAEAMIIELTRRAKKRNWLRGVMVGFCLKRARNLLGMREIPRFYLALLFGGIRRLLLPVGEKLKQAGRLDSAADIFFLNTQEALAALEGKDLRLLVSERRASYDHEMNRRYVPGILLSDGTEPKIESSTEAEPVTDGMFTGIPASGGKATGKARIILNPDGARLEPGEILVAPSTDPGWTPLFLIAGGLVMEKGGPMSHGAIVARELGIPAVVGVAGATEHIPTGKSVRVDGSKGTVTVL
ncbi:MAG TPA: PEP/pyruvate-binding domain-containing protein [Bacillota bacterium]|nr:PEP/pyruvate-binding domain-containing protein [Bacillota bacterium]